MKDTIEIGTNALYQLLICYCRYGYTRNNHLMPDAAFMRCEELLPKLLAVDKDCALRTAKQLCEECISHEIVMRFYDGDDDQSGNRASSIDFVHWLLTWIKENEKSQYRPYNYVHFLENVSIDDKPQYVVSELFNFNMETRKWSSSKILNKDKLLSKNNYLNFILTDVCELKDGDKIRYNKIDVVKDKYGFGKPIKFIYRLLLKTPRTFLVAKKRIKEQIEK